MKKYIFILTATVLALASCDFLDREPIDFGSEVSYFKNADQLKLSVNQFYEFLPMNASFWGGLYSTDCTSDNQVSTTIENLFYKGNKRTVKQEDASCEWKFSNLREINFFINKVDKVRGSIDGDPALIDHYIGEAHWFRAYDHFRLLRNFGDSPILTEMQVDDKNALAISNKRYPRNEVARFIIKELETAAEMMMDNAPESGRLCKDAAYALLSRVALYEATWEKYHANTCFVPGNSKWPGAALWKDFKFEAGSAEAEINFFLDKAIDASQRVASHRTLNSDYRAMFNNTGTFSNNDEVIVARYYLNGVISHSASALLKNGGGCGVTRAAVNTFLMANGKPIYSPTSGYEGDTTAFAEMMHRDMRLRLSVRGAGWYVPKDSEGNPKLNAKNEPDSTNIYDMYVVNASTTPTKVYKPYIYNGGREKATTGYELQKWLSADENQQIQYKCTTAVPVIRAAECYLNYIEAYYERYGNLGGNCDSYWKALRSRAGVDTDYMATITATDLAQENDLGVYSHGKQVDKTLYNIRRERRCELLAEGLRLDDLKRWRSLDNMVNYHPEGYNLWELMYKMYSSSQLDGKVVTSAAKSGQGKYIRPLLVSETTPVPNGYTFPKQHYLEPIPIAEFLLCISPEGVTPTANGNSMLYQNPGWSAVADGTADYDYNCE